MALLPQDPKDQRLLLMAIVPLVLLFAYNQLVRGPRQAEAETLRTHLNTLETKNATARTIAEQQGGPRLVARVAELALQIGELEKLVPRKEEVPLLLREISLRARDTRLQLTRLKPETEEAGEHYVKRTYEISVQGPYHAIGVFLAEVGSLSRIMTPVELKLMPNTLKQTRDGAPILNANFRLLTYIVPPAGEAPEEHVSRAVVAALQATPSAPIGGPPAAADAGEVAAPLPEPPAPPVDTTALPASRPDSTATAGTGGR